MEAHRWQRLQDLFHQAGERPLAEREAFLQDACGDDAELAERVRRLLAADEGAEERLAGAVGTVLAAVAEEPEERERIGPYRVLRPIGRGGMGTVYLAQRDDQHYHMQVAIKVVRRGMDTGDILRRLRQERQILAGLDHPNIARLLDGGSTDDGLPYFVMEYIEGEPIDAYCDHHQLAVAERLELFRQVCAAVHYAHQNLIIHRDLKPSNLLVTRDGVPKLLDFGIAKLLHAERAAETAVATLTGLRLLTPQYASPEQLRGEPLTTASDVYSLGVLLYLLLTGRPPYRLDGCSPAQLEEVICRAEPERPSVAVRRPAEPGPDPQPSDLEQLSKHRSTSPERLRRQLAGDLDNVALMALRKEPRRRYISAEQLSDDLRRHLRRRPVIARPETLGYRTAKFIARNRLALTAATLVLLSLLGGIATTTWQARVAQEQRRRAERHLAEARAQRNRAERVSDFLIDVFQISDPSEAQGRAVTAREILDLGAERISQQLQDQPEDRARAMDTIARAYQGLGFYDPSQRLFEQALELRRQTLAAPHPDLAVSLNNLGVLLFVRNDFAAAEPLLRQALTMRRALAASAEPVPEGEEEVARGEQRQLAVAESLTNLAVVHTVRGRPARAEQLYREALGIQERWLGPESSEVADTLGYLAVLRYQDHDFVAAERLYRRSLEIQRRTRGKDHPSVALGLNDLAAVLHAQGRVDEAEALMREALDLQRRVLGEEHPNVAQGLSNLAALLYGRGNFVEAERLYRETLELKRRVLGPEHLSVATTLSNLADLLTARQRFAEAEQLYRQALRIRRERLGSRHLDVAVSLTKLADLHYHQHHYSAAEPLYREALALQRALRPAAAPELADSLVRLGLVLAELHRCPEAEPLLRQGWELRRKKLGDGDPKTVVAQEALTGCRAQR